MNIKEIHNKKYSSLSHKEMSHVKGGKRLKEIVCIGYRDESGVFIATGTERIYERRTVDGKWKEIEKRSADGPNDLPLCG